MISTSLKARVGAAFMPPQHIANPVDLHRVKAAVLHLGVQPVDTWGADESIDATQAGQQPVDPGNMPTARDLMRPQPDRFRSDSALRNMASAS